MFGSVAQLICLLKAWLYNTQMVGLSSDGYRSLYLQHAVASRIVVLKSCVEVMQNSNVRRRELTRIRLAVAQLESLISELRADKSKSYSCDARTTIKSLIALLQSSDCNIVFTDVSVHKQQCSLPIQAIRLQEAITCLVNNALVANRQQHLPVHVACYREHKRFRVTIRDFGPGMNTWVKSLVFLPLFSLTKNGTGLGLSFARTVIETELKGSIKLFTDPAYGTLVECIIPLTQ